MKINRLIIVLGSLMLASCQTTYAKQASFVPSTNQQENQGNKSEFVYNSSGKEQFVFHRKAEALQQYGYDKFCESTKTFACFNKLPYHKYVGMKGYFDSSEPAKTDFSGYEFYPVILENGEKYYFVANKKYGGKYGHSSPIISFDQYTQLKSFKVEPLIPNSPIQLVGNEMSYGTKYYDLSNGKKITDKNLKLIREVCTKFGNKPKMAELLLGMKIDKDDVDYKFFISPTGDSLRSEAKLYIGFNDQSQWLRFKVKFYGDDWLFVKSYKVAADDYRWQSPKMDFERDHSSGSVWEWIDVSAGKEEIKVAKALANAQKATIRFQGNQYYSDKQLQDDQQNSIKKIIELYSLMGGGA